MNVILEHITVTLMQTVPTPKGRSTVLVLLVTLGMESRVLVSKPESRKKKTKIIPGPNMFFFFSFPFYQILLSVMKKTWRLITAHTLTTVMQMLIVLIPKDLSTVRATWVSQEMESFVQVNEH